MARIIFLFCLVLNSSVFAETAHLIFFQKNIKTVNSVQTIYQFKIENSEYKIYGSGKGIEINHKKEKSFKIGSQEVVVAQYLATKDQILIIYYEGDEMNALLRICSLNRTSLQINWDSSLGGFNLGPSAITEEFIYVPFGNNLVKLNLKSGKEVWSVTLSKKEKIDWGFVDESNFSVKDGKIKSIGGDGPNQKNKVLIDDNTGKVIEYIPASRAH